MSESNLAAQYADDIEVDSCIIHTGLALVPIIDGIGVDSTAKSFPVTSQSSSEGPGSARQHVAALSNDVYSGLNFLWINLLARLLILFDLFILGPRILFLEVPRLLVSGSLLSVTVSWLSASLAFNILAKLLKSAIAWTVLALYLFAFILQATWITLRNVAVARRGRLTIREVLDSISGNRALEANQRLAPQSAQS